ncbi:hypothetical protein N7466_001702 [Penicillium verhagenii]|uniref:uncharacterized protein n=1 Tax=Penicillium verhagenii TaxID=1562060 RepID=UPI0025452167|nr:uncharacterized protein N7466_001702 [Penicillium verhagenii]KAJ5938568.1 hypothetical protein N7466_001702 [Penicillium verhagenii]
MENAAEPPSPPPPTEAESLPTVESSDVSSSEEHGPSTRDVAPHTIVRLIQCHHCSKPLRNPCRLPCGNTVCRECLPPVRPRTGITYPVAEGREEGFTCYWEGQNFCVGDHCVGDCGTDVVLCFVTGMFQEELMGSMQDAELPSAPDADSRVVCWKKGPKDPETDSERQSLQLGQYSWLHGVYHAACEGSFPWDASDVFYKEADAPGGAPLPQHFTQEDRSSFQKLRDRVRCELDCQVCYALILDPLTLPCGHTFCRTCIARVLDHSDLCPICRRKLGMPTSMQAEPTNWTLSRLIDLLFADQVAIRREAVAQDELGVDLEKKLPLFVCTLSFPTMPTFLHIFEPRYRLMIRRVVDSGDGKFGMVMYNRRGRPQADEIGSVPFMHYGTLLMVERYELLPDGRSLVIATGVSRFKVLEAGMLDGYHVARTERVDDISLAEEERLEAMETAAHAIPDPSPEESTVESSLDSMSTQDLMLLAREFIRKQRQTGAPWLHPRVMLAYGPVPTDAARFPWWFSSILPIAEEEKYPILSATSVRERLKICARWARELEALSFGGSAPFQETMRQLNDREDSPITSTEASSETYYIPQTLVVGAFLAIFFAQVGANFLQVLRTGRRHRRQAMELQFPQPIPPQPRPPDLEDERNN